MLPSANVKEEMRNDPFDELRRISRAGNKCIKQRSKTEMYIRIKMLLAARPFSGVRIIEQMKPCN